MALDTVQFVDSIASSPTVLLDLSTTSGWRTAVLDPGVPEIRRSGSQNTMRDGGIVAASSYDMRTLTLTLLRTSSSMDTNAGSIQSLARELDRETNIIKFQADGATAPVFFKTKRSSPSVINYVWQSVGAHHELTIPILAEPFAYGLRETISSGTIGTVNNDPAAGSNGCYFDLSSIKGDVETPLVLSVDRTSGTPYYLLLARRSTGTPTDLPAATQAESMTLETETTNPGGGPDAAMSGSGTNNYRRTTFAGDPEEDRLSYSPGTTALRNALTGRFRAFAAVRRSSASNTVTAGISGDQMVTVPATTSRQLIDLGLLAREMPVSSVAVTWDVYLFAGQSSSGDSLDWDYLTLAPADEQMCIVAGANNTGADQIIDAETESVFAVTTGTALYSGTTTAAANAATWTGDLPRVLPNRTNRFLMTGFGSTAGDYTLTKSNTFSVTAFYHPLYLYIRPAST